MPYRDRGCTYYHLGQDQNAIEDYTKAIQKSHNYAMAYENWTLSYRRLGQNTLANVDETTTCSLGSKY